MQRDINQTEELQQKIENISDNPDNWISKLYFQIVMFNIFIDIYMQNYTKVLELWKN